MDHVEGGISEMAKQGALATIRDRYRESFKGEKSRILDEFIAVAGHHLKSNVPSTGVKVRHLFRCSISRL